MGKKSKHSKAKPTEYEKELNREFRSAQSEHGNMAHEAFMSMNTPDKARSRAAAAGLLDDNPLGDPRNQNEKQRAYLNTIMDMDLNDRDTHGNGDQVMKKPGF